MRPIRLLHTTPRKTSFSLFGRPYPRRHLQAGMFTVSEYVVTGSYAVVNSLCPMLPTYRCDRQWPTTLGNDFPISTAKNDQNGRVSVAASEAHGFLVTFGDERTSKFTRDVYAQRVDTSGKLQGGNFPVSNAAGTQQWSALAYSSGNTSYLVAWSDSRTHMKTLNDIFGQHVAANGALLKTKSTENFVVSVPGIANPVKP